jgi:hypothetical protein
MDLIQASACVSKRSPKLNFFSAHVAYLGVALVWDPLSSTGGTKLFQSTCNLPSLLAR